MNTRNAVEQGRHNQKIGDALDKAGHIALVGAVIPAAVAAGGEFSQSMGYVENFPNGVAIRIAMGCFVLGAVLQGIGEFFDDHS